MQEMINKEKDKDTKKQFKPVPDVECLKYHGTPEKPDIKIFVSHRIDKDSEIIDNPLYIPVRCGAVYDDRENVDMLGDDTGDNISEKRESFCELTVMYWAWKNVKADYYGLCHYRRYLSFAEEELPVNGLNEIIMESMSKDTVDYLGFYDETNLRKKIIKYDLICPSSYSIYDVTPNTKCKNIRENWEFFSPAYLNPYNHDFDLLLDLIKEYSPQYYKYALKYMNGKMFMGFNCFIMRRELFNQMCEFMFPILFEFDKRINKDNYSSTQKRATGYAGEWLFSIWVTYNLNKKVISSCCKPLVAFLNVNKKYDIYPAFKENNVPVVIGLNDGNRPFSAVTFKSILNNIDTNKNYDFIFLQKSDDSSNMFRNELINGENLKLMSLAEGYSNVSVRFYDPKDKIGQIEVNVKRCGNAEEIYYPPLIPWILDKYEKVIYINEKMLLQSDIGELYSRDMDGKFISAIIDTKFCAYLNGFLPDFKRTCDKAGLKLKNIYNYFSMDIIVFDTEKCRQNISKEDVITNMLDLQEKLNVGDYINDLFDGQVSFIPQSWRKLFCTDYCYQKLIEFIPNNLHDEQKSISQAKGLSLSGVINEYIAVPQLENGSLFWAIAKETPFYEQLIFNEVECRLNGYFVNNKKNRLRDVLFPVGTKRRQFAKLIYCKIFKRR